MCCLNKLRLLHGYSDDVIPYQPLMPLYTITDLENVPSKNYTHTQHTLKNLTVVIIEAWIDLTN